MFSFRLLFSRIPHDLFIFKFQLQLTCHNLSICTSSQGQYVVMDFINAAKYEWWMLFVYAFFRLMVHIRTSNSLILIICWGNMRTRRESNVLSLMMTATRKYLCDRMFVLLCLWKSWMNGRKKGLRWAHP